MVFLIQALYRLIRSPRVKQVKPFTLHCSLLFVVFAYALIGGLIFNKLEADATVEQQRQEWEGKRECVEEALENTDKPLPLGEQNSNRHSNKTAQQILSCFKTEPDARSQWGLVTATLYGFGIVTTLGYNRIAPITLSGRLFCVFYGICGIPMTMIIIANIGQYLNQFAGATRKNIEAYRERRRRSRVSISGEDIGDSSIEVMSVGLLISFLLYVCFGAVLLPLLNGTFDFYNGIYFNFLCLTAIDFGQLVPSRWAFLPITFLYVCIGLAITTIAIDIGSEYMKKLHHFGKKMKNVASTKIWFGGKTLRVKDLLHAVGRKCGIDPSEIDKIDLENIVERQIALNEGRELPPDTNDDPLPPKEPRPPSPEEQKPLLQQQLPLPPKKPPHPSPPLMVQADQRFFGGPPVERIFPLDESHGKKEKQLNLELCKFIAIDMDEMPNAVEVLPEEEALSWTEPPKVVVRPQQNLVEPNPDIAFPAQLMTQSPPQVIVDDATHRLIDLEPKKFKEKKEKYGRDPKKLYETYQEEWERLERLSDRKLGPRRKSVLALNTLGGAFSPTSSAMRGRDSSMDGAIGSAGLGPASVSRSPVLRRSAAVPRPSLAPSTSSHVASSECSVADPSSPDGTFPPAADRCPTSSPLETTHQNLPPKSRASISPHPHVLRPPSPRALLMHRRSSSPRKLSMTKFKKFGEIVAHPVIRGTDPKE